MLIPLLSDINLDTLSDCLVSNIFKTVYDTTFNRVKQDLLSRWDIDNLRSSNIHFLTKDIEYFCKSCVVFREEEINELKCLIQTINCLISTTSDSSRVLWDSLKEVKSLYALNSFDVFLNGLGSELTEILWIMVEKKTMASINRDSIKNLRSNMIIVLDVISQTEIRIPLELINRKTYSTGCNVFSLLMGKQNNRVCIL